MNKNLQFTKRLAFALQGLRLSWRSESSFRTHVLFAGLSCMAMLILRPAAIWWAMFALVIGFVISAELFNTAIERIADRVQPEFDEDIKAIKDVAAGAVLVAAFTAVVMAAALLVELFL